MIENDMPQPSSSSERVQAIFAYLSDPEKARECASMQELETPEFRAADAPTSLGKTRGNATPVVRFTAHSARHL